MKNSNVSILYDKFLSADCSYYGVLIAYGGLQDVRDVSLFNLYFEYFEISFAPCLRVVLRMASASLFLYSPTIILLMCNARRGHDDGDSGDFG